MLTVPSVQPRSAEPPSPLSVQAEVTVDDWTEAILHATDLHRPGRGRWMLTVLLPFLWFMTLLFTFAHWFTEGSERNLTVFMNDIGRLLWGPNTLFLLIVSLVIVAAYLLQPVATRRQVCTLLRRVGFVAPVPIAYALDAGGITSRETHRSVCLPWPRIRRMDDTDRHLFFLADTSEEPAVLPKRALSEAELAQARRWGEAMIGVPPPAGTPPAAAPGTESGGALKVTFTLTAQDRTAQVIRTQEQPHMRRKRMLGFLLFLMIASLATPLFFAVAWMVDPYRVPLALAFPLYVEMFATHFWQPAAGAAVLVAALIPVHKWLRRLAAAGMGQDLQSRADPSEIELTIDEAGVASIQADSHGHYGWAAFQGIERTPEHIFLPLSRGSVLILPQRALDDETRARFDALVARHLDHRPDGTEA